MIYRSEIDGLRAVAIIPVVFFHAGFEAFSGGYIGVDVFFVISGYLITTVILEQQREGAFRLIDFYERRMRRILPATFLVMVCIFPLGWIWLLPGDFVDLGKSIVATVLFASNVLFYAQVDYFNVAAELKPLLHTWSLGLEEQYYIFLPLTLLLIRYWSLRSALVLFSFFAIASFCVALFGADVNPSAAFFLLPARFFELGIGTLLAYHLFDRQPSNKGEWGSLVGLAMIVGSLFFVTEETRWPSAYTLIPTIGTALVIACTGPDALVTKVLKNQVLVTIGLISFGIYLWHQPLFAFARMRTPGELTLEASLGLMMASVALAYFSWKFVEQPFRNRAIVSRTTVFVSASLGSALLLLAGIILVLQDGFPNRTSAANTTLGAINAELRINYGLSSECDGSFTLSPNCSSNENPQMVLWGDSYAMHLAPMLEASATQGGFRQQTKSECRPVLGMTIFLRRHTQAWAESCLHQNDAVVAWLSRQASVEYVLIASPFTFPEERLYTLADGIVEGDPYPLILNGLRETISVLRNLGLKPIVVAPPPTTGHDLGRCVAASLQFGLPMAKCNFDEETLTEEAQVVAALMREAASFVPVFDLKELICSDQQCRTHIGNTPIYRDRGHLSVKGSRMLGLESDPVGQLMRQADNFWAIQTTN